jgi:hypothetical protein
MLGIFKSAVKAAAVVVDLPVSAAKDVLTIGDEKIGTHTGDAVNRFTKNVKNIADPEDK